MDKRRFEPVGIIVEKLLDIGNRRRCRLRPVAQDRELEACPEDIVFVDVENPPIGLDGRLAKPRLFAIFAEQKPAGAPAGREFQRLLHQFGRRTEVATGGQHACIVGAPVGDKVAGGEVHGCHVGRFRLRSRAILLLSGRDQANFAMPLAAAMIRTLSLIRSRKSGNDRMCRRSKTR